MAKDSDSDTMASGLPRDDTTAGTRFRIKVCMKEFFSDERANAYVCVREGQRVRWLQRRLRTLFALPPRFVLLSRGYLLPPDEPLAVLERDDIVDVMPTHDDVDCHRNVAMDDDLVSRAAVSAPESGIGDCDVTTPALKNREVLTSKPDEKDDDSARTDVSASVVDEDDELRERKRRALALLEQLDCGGPEEVPRTVRPRRRRVRRRRRVTPLPDPTENIAPTGEDNTSTSSTSPDKTASARGASVLRNGCQQSRPPRVIRPLDEVASL